MKATNNEQGNFFELLNLLDEKIWNVEEIFVPCVTAEKKLDKLNQILKQGVHVNEFRDCVEMF